MWSGVIRKTVISDQEANTVHDRDGIDYIEWLITYVFEMRQSI